MRFDSIIPPELAQDILKRAMSTGATFAEIFLEDKRTSTIGLADSKIKRNVHGLVYGAGIRAFFGTQSVYGFTSDLSKEALFEVADMVAGAHSMDARTPVSGFKFDTYGMDNRDLHKIDVDPFSVNVNEKIDFLRALDQAAREVSPFVEQVDAAIGESSQKVEIFNSEGVHVQDIRTYTRPYVSVIATRNGQKQTGSESPGIHGGYEFVRALHPQVLAQSAAKRAVLMLDADYAPSGKMPVVIDNGFGGVIFHEACGHALEANSIARKASVFNDMMGQQIAHECVSAVDDGTIGKAWGSSLYDDEGTPTRRTLLIENGILKSYMVDKLNGLRINMESTGSGRRESYRFAPTSRMRNTFILPGPHTLKDLIATVKDGIYAAKMGGGSVMPATGEFNFAVIEGYMIKNGAIDRPVRGATLVGNGADILKKIVMVGNELDMAQGMCGSSSGSVPTCVGQPPVLVSEIVVGGRK